MKYRYLLPFFLSFVLIFSSRTNAQLVGGTDAFMQGQFLECAISTLGAWGNNATPPATYHPRGGQLDFSYDSGHDGWVLGSFGYYGPYFLPGTPFDGWSVQVDDTMSSAFYSTGYFDTALGGILGGGVAGYSGPDCVYPNAAAAGIWKGTAGLHRAGLRNALQITQVSEVDKWASWVTVTAKFVNTTDSVLKGVYYMATADPDNDVTVGGSYPTDNHIAYQEVGGLNRHEVYARPPSINQDAFSGLATQDCRAKALIYQSWPPAMVTGNNLDKVYNETATSMGTCYYTLGATTFDQDIAYGLVFNLGNIGPRDSTFITFAWIFSDTNVIDSIYRVQPKFSTLGKVHTSSQPDSVFGCTLAGCRTAGKTFEANVLDAEYRDWSFSKWTWTPSIGLSATTGTRVTVDVGLLSGPVTYTITGTPVSTGGSCRVPPAPITFTMYVQPCFLAKCDTPCETDTLHLTGLGDSTGATYMWYGPGGGVVNTGQFTTVYPVSAADTGTYMLVKTVGSDNDTTYTHASIRFLPHVTASADTPCSQTTLSLKATAVFTTIDSFRWTGPNSFTSVTQNPTIPIVPTKNAGLYKVVAALNGCFDSGYVTVMVDTTPEIPVATSNSSGLPGEKMICAGDTLLLFATDATVLPIDYTWTGPGTFTSTDQNPMIAPASNASAGVYSVTATIGKCFSTGGTNVKIAPVPPLAATSNSPVCSGGFNHLDLQATSLPGATFTWTGPHTFFSTDQNPIRLPVLMDHAGVYKVVVLLNGCTTFRYDTVVVNETPLAPWTKWLTFCQYYLPDPLQAMGENILWYTAHKDTMIGSKFAPVPNTNIVGETFYYATQTVKGCISPLDSMKITVYPTPSITMSENVVVCPHESATLKSTNTDALAYYHWFPSTYLSDTVSAVVVVRPETNIHYTLVASNMFGCTDTAHVAVTVKAGAVLEAGDSATIYPGEKYQLNAATNCTYITWFPSTGLSDAHITNPVASPLVSTRYIATGITEFGCKVKDSVDIRVSKETLLDLPNAFTPGNGSNSKFKILKRGIADLKSFSVYNRWGQKVFETANIDEGWDGSFNGKPQPFGVYIYDVKAVTSSGEDFVKRGNVTLIR